MSINRTLQIGQECQLPVTRRCDIPAFKRAENIYFCPQMAHSGACSVDVHAGEGGLLGVLYH